MADYPWYMPVLVAAAIVFIIDLIGNFIKFDNRILNALAQAVLFAVVFGLLTAYFTPTEVAIAPVAP